jgi:hypothetical protein
MNNLKRWQIATLFVVTIASASFVLFYNYRKRKLKRFAMLFEGIKEIGNNQGFNNEAFESMLREIGWRGGEAWCMYFAKAIYVFALPKLAEDFNKSLSGSTQLSFNNVASGKSASLQIVTSGKPKVGDIAIWQRVNDSSRGHAGVVVKVKNNGNVYETIEGNTNFQPSFQGEGDLVDRLEHELNYGGTNSTFPNLRLRGFIRLT